MELTRSKVRPWKPTPEQRAMLRATDATVAWLWDLPDEVRLSYAGQWIAARDCQIVASAPTMAELCDKLNDPDDPTVIVDRIEKGVSIR